jgi:hypothetical protein
MESEKTSGKRDDTTVEEWGSAPVRAFPSGSVTTMAREAILRKSADENPILFSKYAAYLAGTSPKGRMMVGVVEVDGVRYRLYPTLFRAGAQEWPETREARTTGDGEICRTQIAEFGATGSVNRQ